MFNQLFTYISRVFTPPRPKKKLFKDLKKGDRFKLPNYTETKFANSDSLFECIEDAELDHEASAFLVPLYGCHLKYLDGSNKTITKRLLDFVEVELIYDDNENS